MLLCLVWFRCFWFVCLVIWCKLYLVFVVIDWCIGWGRLWGCPIRGRFFLGLRWWCSCGSWGSCSGWVGGVFRLLWVVCPSRICCWEGFFLVGIRVWCWGWRCGLWVLGLFLWCVRWGCIWFVGWWGGVICVFGLVFGFWCSVRWVCWRSWCSEFFF